MQPGYKGFRVFAGGGEGGYLAPFFLLEGGWESIPAVALSA